MLVDKFSSRVKNVKAIFYKNMRMANQMFWCGYNGFNQFSCCKKLYSDKLEKFESSFEEGDTIDCISLWNYTAFRINNKLHIIGAFQHDIEYDNRIKKISGTEKHCLVLLENGDLYRFLLDTKENTKLDFIFSGETLAVDKNDNEMVIDISCGIKLNIAITNKNSFYSIPIKCFDFPKENKIRQICCGNEHVAILNGNGDIFVWGSGLRGQHGNGEVSDVAEHPVLIDALSGVKIIEIACGGWHVAAITAFHDLYLWGWNSNGQLGHDSTVTSIPTLIEFGTLNIRHVSCGLRHTAVQTDTGKLLVCGWNKYGQLGLPSKNQVEENKFREIKIDSTLNLLDYKLKCGDWSTVLIKSL